MFKRIFPSIPASIVTGIVMIPLFIAGMKLIASFLHPGVLLLVAQLTWAVMTFFAPVLLSTMDISRYVRSRRAQMGRGIFSTLPSREDFAELYVPAWIRVAILISSAAASLIVLHRLGVPFLQ